MWSNNTQLSPFDVLTTVAESTDVQETPGTVGSFGWTSDGRAFRLAKLAANGTTLAPCKLTQGPAQVAGYHLGTVSAQAIGDTSITYTFAGGAASVALNAFAGGYLSIVTGTGAPQQVQIGGNGAVTSSTTIVLQLQDPLVVATAVTDTAEVYRNAFAAPIIAPSTAFTGFFTGVPLVSVVATSATLGTYFWAQTGGPCTILGQGTTGIGLAGSNSTTTPGAMMVGAATTPQLAIAVEAGADTLYTMWDLRGGRI
jgi:hypothetical protein